MPDPSLYLPSDIASPAASAVAVFGFGTALLGGLLLAAAWLEQRHRRRAASVRAVLAAGRIEHAGFVGLCGRVERDPTAPHESGPVAVVEIDQFGHQERGGTNPSIVWTETARRVNAQPFYLVTAQGDRVRVEPDARFMLADEQLTKTFSTAPARRLRRAEINAGDEVYVVGEASEGYVAAGDHAGYRGGARGFVLRAPAGRPLVVSRERPEDRHARREGFHGAWALAFAAALVVLHLGFFARYDLLSATGHRVWGQNAWADERLARHRAGRAPRYEHWVHADLPTPTATLALHARTSYAVFTGVNSGYRQVPFLVSTVAPQVHEVGRHPVLPIRTVLLSVVASSLLALLYLSRTAQTRAWFDRARIRERERGYLAQRAGHAAPPDIRARL